MNLDHVFVKMATSVVFSGIPVGLRMGSHWLADDPLVLANPALFTKDCRYGLQYSGEPPEVMKLPPDEDEPEPTGLPRTRGRPAAARA